MSSESRTTWRVLLRCALLCSLALAVGCGDGQKKETRTAKDEKGGGAAAGGGAAGGDQRAAGAATGGAGKQPLDQRIGKRVPLQHTGPAPTGEVRQAVMQVRRGQHEAAIQTCRRALRKNEKYTPAMVVMARAYFHLGKHEFAEAMCLQTALKINPNSGGCYNLLGHIALKQEDEALALKNFEKATKVEPSFGPAWLNYGAMLVRVKNFTAAVPVLERAVQLLPSRAEAHLNLGAAYRGAGRLMKARSSLLKALSMRARYPDAYFNLGLLYLDAIKVFDGKNRLQQLSEAVAYFNRYKQSGAYKKDDPVNDYIQQAHDLHKKEVRRLEREKRRQAREAARKAAAAQQKKPGAK